MDGLDALLTVSISL